ncbi:hypothetical protein D3C71_1329860 [compost metagenome]
MVTHLRNAEGAHRHPEVGQQAAEPIEGELAQRRRLQEREQQAGHQPEAQHVGREPQPAAPQRLGIGEAQQGAPQQAEQAWEQHLDAALGSQMLPAQARQLGHQRHQAEGQRHEDGIEIGGAHRERAQMQGLEHHGVEGAEQHAGAGHAEQQDGCAEQPLF